MRKYFDDKYEIFSAGIYASDVDTNAVRIMNEIGVDISNHISKSIEMFLNKEFDYLITVCDDAKEMCPVFIGRVKNRLHWSFEDPAAFPGIEEERIKKFREIRDLIRDRILQYFGSRDEPQNR